MDLAQSESAWTGCFKYCREKELLPPTRVFPLRAFSELTGSYFCKCSRCTKWKGKGIWRCKIGLTSKKKGICFLNVISDTPVDTYRPTKNTFLTVYHQKSFPAASCWACLIKDICKYHYQTKWKW